MPGYVVTIALFGVFVLCVFVYHKGKAYGFVRGHQMLAIRLRESVQAQIVKPWLDKFRERFVRDGKSYVVDLEFLKYCHQLAQRLHELEWITPDHHPSERVYGYDLDVFILSARRVEVDHSDFFNPWDCGPKIYVDAILGMARGKDGKLPDRVWMNVDTLVPFPVTEFRVYHNSCNYFHIKDLRHHNI